MNKLFIAVPLSATFLLGGCTVVTTNYDPMPVRSAVVVTQPTPFWGQRAYYRGTTMRYYNRAYIGSRNYIAPRVYRRNYFGYSDYISPRVYLRAPY